MPKALHVPRVNNNDDEVTIVNVAVKTGDFVRRGQIVGAVETDKAVLDVEAEQEGFVLKVVAGIADRAAVGSVLLWLGDSADEKVPEHAGVASSPVVARAGGRPTAKARALLKELGIGPEQVPAAGERVTEADVRAWLAGQEKRPVAAPSRPFLPGQPERAPDVPGEFENLSPEEHGMLATVLWHRDQAASGYVETEYDPAGWDDYSRHYAAENRLMLPPLMPLMAFRLVELARENPRINSAIVDGRRYRYGAVNLGFTVQSGQMLYLTVVRDAQSLDAAGFIASLGEIQRRAMARKLAPSEMSGATIAFTSMARWNVSRHIPILPPQTGLIVAHSAPRGSGKATLGATYDHRLLSGFDVVQVLQSLTQPTRTTQGEQP